MQQLILNSILIATFAIPAIARRRARSGDEGFLPVLRPVAVFVAVYVVLLLYVYPRLF